jgi:hypothetical protein
VSLFLLKETNIHTISMLIYHGMRNVSVRSVHRLAVDKRTCAFEMREFQYSVLDESCKLGYANHVI